MDKTQLNVILTVSAIVTGHIFIIFIPGGLRLVYFLLVYPVLWVVGGFLAYKFYLHRKEQDKFLGK